MDRMKTKRSPIPFSPELSEVALVVTDYSEHTLLQSTVSLAYSRRIDEAVTTEKSYDTISVVSSPWSAESWYSESEYLTADSDTNDPEMLELSSSSQSSFVFNSSNDTFTVQTANPSSTSLNVQDQSLGAYSKTITLVNIAAGRKASKLLKTREDTTSLTSWSETFTSFGLPSRARESVVKFINPWSSIFSCTECYPSSISTFVSTIEGKRTSLVIPSSIYSLARPNNSQYSFNADGTRDIIYAQKDHDTIYANFLDINTWE